MIHNCWLLPIHLLALDVQLLLVVLTFVTSPGSKLW